MVTKMERYFTAICFLLLFALTESSAESLNTARILRRYKRRWVLTTLEVTEEDQGPFPKIAGDLFNDRSVNMTIKYLISGPGVDELPEVGLFSVNDSTGRVFVHRKVDREKTKSFVIRFDAVERSTGRIVDRSLIFNVKVKDINDNAPTFSQNEYNITINESVNSGNPVFVVNAQDIDDPDSPNSEVTYSIIAQNPKLPGISFTIDPKKGLIWLQGCLNYEVAKIIKLVIQAKDNGIPMSLSSSTTVTINVADRNNNPPVFTSKNFETRIQERAVHNGTVRLSVADKDTPFTPAWSAVYKIVEGNEQNNYVIETDKETNEGILNIVKPLDYEDGPIKNITVSVENEEPLVFCTGGKAAAIVGPNNATVTITLDDVNDPPEFAENTIIVRQTDNQKASVKLGRFNATDPDTYPKNNVRYEIADDPENWVVINEKTGEVTTVNVPDREAPSVKDNVYRILVHAIDDGTPSQTGTGTMLIHLFDINDNAPYLVSSRLEVCEENEGPMIVKAADKDIDPYAGPFRFTLLNTEESDSRQWKLSHPSGPADVFAELSKTDSVPLGNYTLHLSIEDRQGLSAKQTLHVRVCACSDGLTCDRAKPPSSSLGGGAIAAIFTSLTLILVGLCLLMLFASQMDKKGRKNNFLYEEGSQTLISYNEEAGGTAAMTSPALVSQCPSWNGGPTKQVPQVVGRTDVDGDPYKTSAGHGLRPEIEATYHQNNLAPGRSISLNSGIQRNAAFDMLFENVGELLTQRVYHIKYMENNAMFYKPQTYAFEGELEKKQSLDCLSIPETDTGFDFLNDIGPKFSKVAEICFPKKEMY
ncbi:cadherin-like protein 26 [Protopterus annectens]|uniref:cadherin-like protein 26 n=1 Tax=Protopterus annectens TaxID=7888 RepID=UPI001CFA2529|nr:cadherin-like protein 26 [Protopterus annectens]